MKCSQGLCLFVMLVLLCFLVIPLHMGFFRIHITQRLAENLFNNFTAKYNKSYLNPKEFQWRLGVFRVSLFL